MKCLIEMYGESSVAILGGKAERRRKMHHNEGVHRSYYYYYYYYYELWTPSYYYYYLSEVEIMIINAIPIDVFEKLHPI